MENKLVKINKPISEMEELKIDWKKQSIKATLKAFTFLDNNYVVVYMPSLGLTGYGDTQNDANEMLNESVNDYFDNLSDAHLKLQ